MKEKENIIYKGKIFDLIQKDVVINDKIYQRDIIRHPGGVGVLVTKEGKILFVKQFRHAINKETLEIPALVSVMSVYGSMKLFIQSSQLII